MLMTPEVRFAKMKAFRAAMELSARACFDTPFEAVKGMLTLIEWFMIDWAKSPEKLKEGLRYISQYFKERADNPDLDRRWALADKEQDEAEAELASQGKATS